MEGVEHTFQNSHSTDTQPNYSNIAHRLTLKRLKKDKIKGEKKNTHILPSPNSLLRARYIQRTIVVALRMLAPKLLYKILDPSIYRSDHHTTALNNRAEVQ